MVDGVEAGLDFIPGGEQAAVGAVQIIDVIAFHGCGRVHQTPDTDGGQGTAFLCVGFHENITEQPGIERVVLRNLGLVEVANGHFCQLNIHAQSGIGFDGFLHIGDNGGLQTAFLFSIAAHITLHANAVDQGTGIAVLILRIGLNAFYQRAGRFALRRKEQVIVVVEQFDIRTEIIHGVSGAEEGILNIVVPDIFQETVFIAVPLGTQTPQVCDAVFAAVVADGFIDDVPAVDDAGKFLFKMIDDPFNITGKAGTHRFLISDRLAHVIVFMEKPLGHISVPDKHMAPDADVVFLGPGDHGIRPGVAHAGHAVLGGFRRPFIQQGIGLGLIAAGQGVEMAGQEIHKYLVPHIIIAESTAELEPIRFSQFPHGIIIFRNSSGFLSEDGQGKKANQEDKKEGQKAFHEKESPLVKSVE